MENEYGWVIIGIILLIIGSCAGYLMFHSDGMSEADLNETIASQVNQQVGQQISQEVQDATLSYQTEITRLKDLINQTANESESVVITDIKESSPDGYNFENVLLAEPFSKVFSDRELNLYDTEVEFDDDDYDIEELFYVSGTPLINQEDFEENVYLGFEKESLFYHIEIDPSLDTSAIDDGENLKFNFLGSPITISEWNIDNEITLSKGSELTLDEGASVIVEGKEVTLSMVLDSDHIYVIVDGQGEKIKEENVEKVNGLEIRVAEVLYSEKSGYTSKAVLQIGDEVEVEIKSGDEFEEDSIWEWSISNHLIGLVLSEEFLELDDRDGFNVLDVDEEICLPNDYLCVAYFGLTDEDLEDYSFELDGDLIVVEGKFTAGINDYDEIFLNLIDNKFYEDNDCNIDDLIDSNVFFGDSEIELTFNASLGLIYIDNINVSTNLNEIFVGSENVSSNEDNFRTSYGIIIEEPENSIEDERIKITVPEEQLEVEVSVI